MTGYVALSFLGPILKMKDGFSPYILCLGAWFLVMGLILFFRHEIRREVKGSGAFSAMPEQAEFQKISPKPKSLVRAEQKVLRGMRAFKGKTGGSEAFEQEKRAEIEREERGV